MPLTELQKLDIEVATKVLGKTLCRCVKHHEDDVIIGTDLGNDPWRCLKCGCEFEARCYSTNLSDAFEVLTKFGIWTLEKNSRGKFICMIPGTKSIGLVVKVSTTPCIAICYAGLEAMGFKQ